MALARAVARAGQGMCPPSQEGMERVPPMLSSFPEAPPGADAPCGSFQAPLSHEDTLLSWCCSPGCDGSQEHMRRGKLCTLNGNDHSNPQDSAGCWKAGQVWLVEDKPCSSTARGRWTRCPAQLAGCRSALGAQERMHQGHRLVPPAHFANPPQEIHQSKDFPCCGKAWRQRVPAQHACGSADSWAAGVAPPLAAVPSGQGPGQAAALKTKEKQQEDENAKLAQ